MPALRSLLLLAAALAAAALLVPSCDGKGPRTETRDLVLDRAYVDFGKVLHGKQPSERFLLTNHSPDRRLTLREQQSSCSCASAGFRILGPDGRAVDRSIQDPPRIGPDGQPTLCRIDPGESLEVTITVHSGERPPVARVENATTMLRFDPPEVGVVKLGYDFEIDPRLVILPRPEFGLPPIATGERGIEAIELAPTPGKPAFSITHIDGLGPGFVLTEVPATRPEGRRYRLDYGPFPADRGRFVHELVFHTDLEDDYAVTVRIGVDSVPVLQLLGPPAQTFGRFDFAESRSCDLQMRYHGELERPLLGVQDLRVQDRDGNDVSDRFRTEILHPGGKRWDVRVHYLGGLSASRFGGDYVLHTAVPGFTELQISLTGFNLAH